MSQCFTQLWACITKEAANLQASVLCGASIIKFPDPIGDPLHDTPISVHLKAVCSAAAGVMPEGPRPLTGTVLTAVENTPGIHNLVVCTPLQLCAPVHSRPTKAH